MSQWRSSQRFFFFKKQKKHLSQSVAAEESFEWKVNRVRQEFPINILRSVLPLPPLFLLLLPFFHLFQINRVALIQCVSCRLPWRPFDPVFQSLPLGQTCFSSVCCTPALEAAAALRQTMGCCARLAPPFSSCRSHFPLCFLSPRYLSLLTIFFGSQVLSNTVSLSYSLCFPLVTPKQPSLSMGIQNAQGKRRGQDLSEAALQGEKRGRQGTSLCAIPPHSLSVCTVDLIPLKNMWPVLLSLNLYLLYLFNYWCLAVVFFLLSSLAAHLSVAYRWEAAKLYCCRCCAVIQSSIFISVCAHSCITKQQ